ncbi:hypothetical protein ZOSMA_168G00120 [Zostera marina]|uniref:Uncharacterized protein n=1 Tax=Zostera marina TaxID=29655 RepID=A0A0K9PTI2_ZOSMR|nr:hypothetical protein ZOSMA_168G00120 [Zostera marina]
MDKEQKVYAGNSGKAVSAGNFETNQKHVTYWEDKNTGEYIRNTVTEKSNPNESRQYRTTTTTVGNKSTGDYVVKQSQQVCKNNDCRTLNDVIDDGSDEEGVDNGGCDEGVDYVRDDQGSEDGDGVDCGGGGEDDGYDYSDGYSDGVDCGGGDDGSDFDYYDGY